MCHATSLCVCKSIRAPKLIVEASRDTTRNIIVVELNGECQPLSWHTYTKGTSVIGSLQDNSITTAELSGAIQAMQSSRTSHVICEVAQVAEVLHEVS